MVMLFAHRLFSVTRTMRYTFIHFTVCEKTPIQEGSAGSVGVTYSRLRSKQPWRKHRSVTSFAACRPFKERSCDSVVFTHKKR
jgi:hypothetical protein